MTQPAEPPDRCARCHCEDCGGLLTAHSPNGCTCENCSPDPDLACDEFLPSRLIGYLTEQLAPLLSAHLHERARRRCLAVAHAAYHALLDYDRPAPTSEDAR